MDHRSDRTGVRLSGPAPEWSRPDGGEAGLHPSNIHDSPYPVGGIMISGGTPVVVGPDGPSLGGFVVPAGGIPGDPWRLAPGPPRGPVRPGTGAPGPARPAPARPGPPPGPAGPPPAAPRL